MRIYEEYITPGPMHQVLSKTTGEWKVEISSWNNPSGPADISEGTSKYEMILGGRYLLGKHTADLGNMKMEGMEISGYDNAKKKFFSTWIDNGGTGVLYQEGTYDSTTKSINFSGSFTDPMGNEVKVRQVIRFIDDNNTIMEMYMIQDGEETKWMEMKSTRV
jgi:hypothetical protein